MAWKKSLWCNHIMDHYGFLEPTNENVKEFCYIVKCKINTNESGEYLLYIDNKEIFKENIKLYVIKNKRLLGSIPLNQEKTSCDITEIKLFAILSIFIILFH